ncbi:MULTISPECIES: hypothetical protein [Streptomyces]|uniref:MFS transporter n=2 Tax=Streptomyces TaxID=1883 RepID=A0ABV9J2J2_9ACTN
MPVVTGCLWPLVAPMVPVAGGSLALPGVTAPLLDRVPAERAGTAGGALNDSRRLGSALAVAALATDTRSFHDGLRTSLLTAAFLVLPAARRTELAPR